MTRITRRTLLGAAPALLAPALASAQAGPWPNRPIRIVVPFPPGGSVDPLARTVGQKLGEALGQQVVVDNRPGGNTVIGTDFVAKAPADGYTLLLTASSHVTQPQLLQAPFDPIKDFTPVATLSTSDMIIVAHPSVPANNVRDLIALAKQQPGKLNYSSAGNGNPNHLAGELLDMMAGVKTTHVPYKGGAPAINDLVGGQVQFSYGSPLTVLPHIRGGRLKALAVTSPQRMSILPEVPTVAESGLPGYEIRIWYGLLAPAGTPREIVSRLNTEINKITELAETRTRFEAAGMERHVATAERFEQMMRTDMDKFGRIIKTANVKLD
ncbi:MAG TPA: tripartite tricarboxylate transporter substrate binding protein [Ramlibacter sp.]|nr:tripartite tricarboxylate transporter substrate binding protein [Ramlibacter sp.]